MIHVLTLSCQQTAGAVTTKEFYVCFHLCSPIPKCSMYVIFTYIYHQFKPNVGKYSIHGASGVLYCLVMVKKIWLTWKWQKSLQKTSYLKQTYSETTVRVLDKNKKQTTFHQENNKHYMMSQEVSKRLVSGL